MNCNTTAEIQSVHIA